jgi:hypothetical protein
MKRVLAVLFAVSIEFLTGCGGTKGIASRFVYKVSPAVLEADGNVDVVLRVTFPPKSIYRTAEVEITPILKYNGKEGQFDNTIVVQGEGVRGNGNICSYANGCTFFTKSSIRFEDEMRHSELYVRAKIKAGNKQTICPDTKVADGIIAPTASYKTVKYESKVLELRNGNVEMEMDIALPKDFFWDAMAKVEFTPVLKYKDIYNDTERTFATYTIQGEDARGNNPICYTDRGGSFKTKSSIRFEEGMRHSELYVRAKSIVGDIEINWPDVKVADAVLTTSDPSARNYEIDQISEHYEMKLVGRLGYISVRIGKADDKFLLFTSLHDDIEWPLDGRYLVISGEDYASFEKNMAIVNEKYAKWTQTAKTEGVKNFRKTIVDFGDRIGRMSLFKMRGTTKLYAVFEVDEMGKCLLKFGSQEIDDSQYAYSNYAPYYTFYSPEDFRKFYEITKYDNAMKNYEKIKAKVDAKKKSIEDRDAKFD